MGTRREQKKTAILDASARVFARKGYAGTVMKDIAVEAGIGKGTIYEYFPSKEDLFFAVFEWYVDHMDQQAHIQISGLVGSTAEKLYMLTRSMMKAGMETRDIFSLSMEFWAASASSPRRDRFRHAMRDVYVRFRKIFNTLLREGMERGEFHADLPVEAISAVLVGSCDSLFLQMWFDETFDPESTACRFMTTFLRGISTEGHFTPVE
jgi:AcrR family transcriptional regulator